MTDVARPSERSGIEAAHKEKMQREADARTALMREDFALTFGSEHGKRVLAWMVQRSGYGKIILSAAKDGKIDPLLTTFAAMEYNFYIEIRRHIPIEILQQCEYGFIKPSGTFSEDITAEAQPNKRTKSKTKRKGK